MKSPNISPKPKRKSVYCKSYNYKISNLPGEMQSDENPLKALNNTTNEEID